LLGCRFPDGSFAMMSMVERNSEIDIPGLDPAIIAASRDVVSVEQEESVGRYA